MNGVVGGALGWNASLKFQYFSEISFILISNSYLILDSQTSISLHIADNIGCVNHVF